MLRAVVVGHVAEAHIRRLSLRHQVLCDWSLRRICERVLARSGRADGGVDRSGFGKTSSPGGRNR